MKSTDERFVSWLVARWWASALLSLVVIAIGVGMLVSPEAGWLIRYTVGPLCLVSGAFALFATFVNHRRRRSPGR